MSYHSPLVSSTALKSLQGSIPDTLPYCSGILPVGSSDLAIYYGKGENACQLSLHRPSMSSLEHLVNTCGPASFGRGNENVYDESYRKAGKLSSDSFQPMLGMNTILSVLDVIRDRLLGGSEENKSIRAELYNLNIYGEGSFFKAHVDTPRGEDMFGSLVIFYPTKHEGGTLVLRKNNKEWSFDSSKVLADDQEHQVGYVALYSDVEHEVLPVTSGHRISITYNLYFDHTLASSLPIPLSSALMANTFKSTLEELLRDSSFLSHGGYLGVALEYAYPSHTSAGRDLSTLERCLKGVDADVMKSCKDLGLETSLWTIIDWESSEQKLACKGIVPKYQSGTFGDGDDLHRWLFDNFDAKELRTTNYDSGIHVAWVKPLPEDRWDKQTFIGYGNEYHPDYAYYTVCLLVQVGKPGEREIV
ncbi:hypothetical protein JOM56_002129 [Amanita muscaria]